MNKTFTKYEDPGHGWLKVSIGDLYDLGIVEKISSYSYYRNGSVYIEEDSDYETFIHAFRAHNGDNPVVKYSHTNRQSKIRSYTRYTHPDYKDPYEILKAVS